MLARALVVATALLWSAVAVSQPVPGSIRVQQGGATLGQAHTLNFPVASLTGGVASVGGGGGSPPSVAGTLDATGTYVTLSGLQSWASVGYRVSPSRNCVLLVEYQRPDGSWTGADDFNLAVNNRPGDRNDGFNNSTGLVALPPGATGLRFSCTGDLNGSPPYGVAVTMQASPSAESVAVSNLRLPYENFFTPDAPRSPAIVYRTHGTTFSPTSCQSPQNGPCYIPLHGESNVGVWCEDSSGGAAAGSTFTVTAYGYDNHDSPNPIAWTLPDGSVKDTPTVNDICGTWPNLVTSKLVNLPPGAAGLKVEYAPATAGPWLLFAPSESASNSLERTTMSAAPNTALPPSLVGVRQQWKRAPAPLSTAVSVSTSATLLPASALADRTSLCVYNNGANTIYLGDSGVTTTSGFPLIAGATYCDDAGSQPLYGVVASGTVNARVLEN